MILMHKIFSRALAGLPTVAKLTFCLALSFNMQVMKSATSFEAFSKLFAAGHRSFEMIDVSSKFQSLKVLVLAGVQIS